MCAKIYTCLCPGVINHCPAPYRTHNAGAPFSPLKINPSVSDVLTMAGQENEILLSCSIKLTQGAPCLLLYRGEGSKKWEFEQKKVGFWPRMSIEKGMGTHTYAHINPHTHTHANIRVQSCLITLSCWEMSSSGATGLWHQCLALCVIRWTMVSNTRDVTQLRSHTQRCGKNKRGRGCWCCCLQQTADSWTLMPSEEQIWFVVCFVSGCY